RFETLRGGVSRDIEYTEKLEGFYQRIEGKGVEDFAADSLLNDYRWLLEEYRVSVFAQKLGTAVPVSEQRIEKLWKQVERQNKRF
ncbi:MAG: DUF3418 domain-containing protein, partial [Pseudomonadales bacterium]|nr:DUF3418 domain-containing protein [Pseudomonadales bacterium]